MSANLSLLERSLPRMKRIVDKQFSSLAFDDRKDLIQDACLIFLESAPLAVRESEPVIISWLLRVCRRIVWRRKNLGGGG